jgi:hypothetical protein
VRSCVTLARCALQQLRDERNLNTMAAREKQLELEQPPVFASNAKNAESNWLADLTVRVHA